ncbi:hypothetical protein [Fimbriiglobus ruber]|uniref:hypothetical protein n=1 Tax=Fimbriiglobus ruber TaxID=1908690 RepID=UPI001379FDF0|nr:hypothetical protein [Fimbriiglobus ruber]
MAVLSANAVITQDQFAYNSAGGLNGEAVVVSTATGPNGDALIYANTFVQNNNADKSRLQAINNGTGSSEAIVVLSPSTAYAGNNTYSDNEGGNYVDYEGGGVSVYSLAPVSSSLTPYQLLTPGQFLVSPNGYYWVTLQPDGNFVLYNKFYNALWASRTSQPATDVVMQGDGNLVVYGPSGATWNSITSGYPGAYLTLQDDGNLVIYDVINNVNTPIWATRTQGGMPARVLSLTPGQSIYSANGLYQLTLQADGNLVEYNTQTGIAAWSSGTFGQNAIEAIMQWDGDLVIYGPTNADGTLNPIWSSGTYGNYGATFSIANTGVMSISLGATVLWSVA